MYFLVKTWSPAGQGVAFAFIDHDEVPNGAHFCDQDRTASVSQLLPSLSQLVSSAFLAPSCPSISWLSWNRTRKQNCKEDHIDRFYVFGFRNKSFLYFNILLPAQIDTVLLLHSEKCNWLQVKYSICGCKPLIFNNFFHMYVSITGMNMLFLFGFIPLATLKEKFAFRQLFLPQAISFFFIYFCICSY